MQNRTTIVDLAKLQSGLSSRELVLKPGGEQDISEGSSKGGESHADDNASPSQDVSPQMSLVSRTIETLILEDDPEKSRCAPKWLDIIPDRSGPQQPRHHKTQRASSRTPTKSKIAVTAQKSTSSFDQIGNSSEILDPATLITPVSTADLRFSIGFQQSHFHSPRKKNFKNGQFPPPPPPPAPLNGIPTGSKDLPFRNDFASHVV
ncbi:hypothetical protein NA56DRAFT_709155 [Hyaloscypha hepaticicola]|uniref:Uncharacterized protein n=1 Tax=Hyaloscypha hepaticicola TaxID=2082293 RepID=A0A2J6PQ86_9HELO|nr:hypothetical protein NA56DRAFT_709155 [Hyaloscypha hepaticicola]